MSSFKDDGDMKLFKDEEVPTDAFKDDGDPNFFGKD